MNSEDITALATVVAALAAAWAGLQATRATRESASLVAIERERREEEARERRSAVLELGTVRRVWNQEHGFEYVNLLVTNRGPMAATNLRVAEEDVDELRMRLRMLDQMFPMVALGPGSSVEVPTLTAAEDDAVVNVLLAWTDGNGEHSEVRSVVLG